MKLGDPAEARAASKNATAIKDDFLIQSSPAIQFQLGNGWSFNGLGKRPHAWFRFWQRVLCGFAWNKP